MTEQHSNSNKLHGFSIKQKRGQLTYDTLIETGFRMLEEKDLQDLKVAELTQEAGYSVGAFYARFKSKEEFFYALVAHHLKRRNAAQQKYIANLPLQELPSGLVSELVSYYWNHRNFWRAVLLITIKDPSFWDPIRSIGLKFAGSFIKRVEAETGREVTASQEQHIYFAFQLVRSTINSSIVNESGPIYLGQKVFVEELTRTFREVSDFDNLVAGDC